MDWASLALSSGPEMRADQQDEAQSFDAQTGGDKHPAGNSRGQQNKCGND
jgi:hypothetical protein